jgi:hypothetical protein
LNSALGSAPEGVELPTEEELADLDKERIKPYLAF